MIKKILKKIYLFIFIRGNKLGKSIKINFHLVVKSSKIGNYVQLGKYVNIYKSTIEDYCKLLDGTCLFNSYLGEYSYVSVSSILQRVKVGKFCSIASKVMIGSTEHPLEYISSHPFLYYENYGRLIDNDEKEMNDRIKMGYVEIGNDVWIGNGAIILSSIKIGDGAIIGAGSVVTKNVPPYAVCVGIPAKIIRYRYDDKQIETLLKIKWWDWNRKEIIKNIDLFKNPTIFFQQFK